MIFVLKLIILPFYLIFFALRLLIVAPLFWISFAMSGALLRCFIESKGHPPNLYSRELYTCAKLLYRFSRKELIWGKSKISGFDFEPPYKYYRMAIDRMLQLDTTPGIEDDLKTICTYIETHQHIWL